MNMNPKNIGGVLGAVFGGASNATPATQDTGAPIIPVAAGTGDNTKVVGDSINRETYGMPDSCVCTVSAYYSLADTETLSLAVEIQESDDGSTWDTAVAIQASTVVVTASGATAGGSVFDYEIKLSDRKQYFRVNVTPDLSASATDTVSVHHIVTLGGFRTNSLRPARQATDEA